MDSILINNRLTVMQGDVIQVPGCEPASAATSSGLSKELFDHCKGSYITLKKALEVIPGSSVHFGSHGDKFFVLPSGPPPAGEECPCATPMDWYQILRDNASSPIREEKPAVNRYNPCSGFHYAFNGGGINNL
jgi:hypothetical protein